MRRRRVASLALAAGAALLAVSPASGEADGPDFYDVRDAAPGEVLELREKPNADAAKLAEIPPGATCLANRGCVGGLTLEEFTTLPEAARREIERTRPRWCKVGFRGVEGWIEGRHLAESASACDPSSAQLTALEAEAARLYALASASGDAPAQEQQAWVVQREACAVAAAPYPCTKRSYLERIAWLRTSSQAARSQDERGISVGPIVYRCEQTDGLLRAFFVRTDPALAYAELGDTSWVYETVPSASGAKYQGAGGEDELLWTKGDGARFRAGSTSPEVSCQAKPASCAGD